MVSSSKWVKVQIYCDEVVGEVVRDYESQSEDACCRGRDRLAFLDWSWTIERNVVAEIGEVAI